LAHRGGKKANEPGPFTRGNINAEKRRAEGKPVKKKGNFNSERGKKESLWGR